MMAYKIAVFLAICGALVGAVNGAMTYSDQTWFPGMDISHAAATMDTATPDRSGGSGEQGAMQPQASDVNLIQISFSMLWIAYSMIKSVLFIGWILCDQIKIYSPSNLGAGNLFLPFALIIQTGVWAVYWMGWLQYHGKHSAKMDY